MLAIVVGAAVMALLSLIAGLVPLRYATKLNLEIASEVSAGIILGSAFLVVIPEGLGTLAYRKEEWLGGLSLSLGYIIMPVIELYFANGGQNEDIDISSLRLFRSAPISPSSPGELRMSMTSLGLIAHSFADGMALGSTVASTWSTTLLIFLAVIVHKAPAAFSLTSLLLRDGTSSYVVKRDIIAFSAAGPIAAITVGAILTLVGEGEDMSAFEIASGACMSFSGGTFAYVAVHIQSKVKKSWASFGRMAGGMMVPFLASLLPE